MIDIINDVPGPRYCKIIATCLRDRVHGNAGTWPGHRQTDLSHTIDGIYKMISMHIQLDIKYPPGANMDTIIVNNVVDTELIATTSFENVRIINRPNIGGSFGAYMEVFQNTKANYDYYIFTEDDVLIGGTTNYIQLMHDMMNINTNTGFLALIGLGQPTHAHGGVGMVSRNLLDATYDNTNPFLFEGPYNRQRSCNNEIDFTNTIQRVTGKSVYTHSTTSWDLQNLCIDYTTLLTDPKYATILENL